MYSFNNLSINPVVQLYWFDCQLLKKFLFVHCQKFLILKKEEQISKRRTRHKNGFRTKVGCLVVHWGLLMLAWRRSFTQTSNYWYWRQLPINLVLPSWHWWKLFATSLLKGKHQTFKGPVRYNCFQSGPFQEIVMLLTERIQSSSANFHQVGRVSQHTHVSFHVITV